MKTTMTTPEQDLEDAIALVQSAIHKLAAVDVYGSMGHRYWLASASRTVARGLDDLRPILMRLRGEIPVTEGDPPAAPATIERIVPKARTPQTPAPPIPPPPPTPSGQTLYPDALSYDDRVPGDESDDGSRYAILAVGPDGQPHPHQRAALGMLWGFAFSRDRAVERARTLRESLKKTDRNWRDKMGAPPRFEDCDIRVRRVRGPDV